MQALRRDSAEGFLVEAEDIELMARRSIERSGLGEALPAPDELAVALGYRVLRGWPPCGPEIAFPNSVLYRPHHDERERSLRIAHGLSHLLLVDEGVDHTEGDAWRLTVELLAPVCLRHCSPLAPGWLLNLTASLQQIALLKLTIDSLTLGL